MSNNDSPPLSPIPPPIDPSAPLPPTAGPCRACDWFTSFATSHPGPIHSIIRTVILTGVTGLGKYTMNVRNETKYYNLHHLHHQILSRPADTALLTVSNHVSTIDDPCIIAAITPWKILCHPQQCRWTWCAHEFCFFNPLAAFFFRAGKVFPISRGSGLSQPYVTEAVNYMRSGDWMHVFPEGRCIPYDGIGSLRWGVGALITRTMKQPNGKKVVVVPFVHHGMEKVMPFKNKFPNKGHTVHVLCGAPLTFDDLYENHLKLQANNPGWGDPYPPSDEWLYQSITARIHHALVTLDQELTHIEQQEQQHSITTSNSSTSTSTSASTSTSTSTSTSAALTPTSTSTSVSQSPSPSCTHPLLSLLYPSSAALLSSFRWPWSAS